jgi:hypothetical protein
LPGVLLNGYHNVIDQLVDLVYKSWFWCAFCRFLPRLRGYFDRDVLVTELAKRTATRDAETLRAAFRGEAGDVDGQDAELGPDDVNMAWHRRWLHEYAEDNSALSRQHGPDR